MTSDGHRVEEIGEMLQWKLLIKKVPNMYSILITSSFNIFYMFLT